MGLQVPRTTFSRKTKTYLPTGEPVEFVGRGAVTAEHIAAAAKLIAVQPCADAVGQRADEITGTGELQRSVNGVGIVHLGDKAYADIALDGCTELGEALEDRGDVCMEVARVEPADIHPVYAQRAALEVVDAQKDVDQRGLPCGANGGLTGGEGGDQGYGRTRAVVPDNGEGLARFDGQIDVAERQGVAFGVTKAEVPF